ncbi:glucosidase [Phycisphaerales bacterium AB-hyl4]|uniref:Glucosidase n=1 Tax=Natronomicrosphaera hydrolytica TaxID=3242702 RepID=A0ABV4U7T1_9BACT
MNDTPPAQAEAKRLDESTQRVNNWQRWGPYLAERQWSTVREDYSPDGDCWNYFPHDHARSRTYRWGEDGLLGLTDRQCRLCFSLALWNGKDSILKERLFGLTNPEGNHGEDVKELYYYLDSSPTHSYLKGLYKYPQAEFPYAKLVEENRNRGKQDDEYELLDTGVFKDDRYFDVQAEYAKDQPNDVFIRITLTNRAPKGSDPAELHLLPTLWFRNTWSWGREGAEGHGKKPTMKLVDGKQPKVETDHRTLGRFNFVADDASDGTKPTWLFTDNESNFKLLMGKENFSEYVKDAFHRYVIEGETDAVNPKQEGTKASPWYQLTIKPGESVTLRMRLHAADEPPKAPPTTFGKRFDNLFAKRIKETDAFYESVLDQKLTVEQRRVARQSHAGLLWTKQFYVYIIEQWLQGDPALPAPPASRLQGRNSDWRQHLYNRDVISMPDKWEYPWYAVWDLAFHMIPFSRIDPAFAKKQLRLFLREWYMHPSGAMPAYEFNFSDVNPPVHAWACWRVYKMAAPRGERDRDFLERVFQKLLLNFTWWVNRKDFKENHIFSGGFLGLDNIGVFDRSQPFADGTHLEQADGTAWMAFYCGTMLSMALELAEPYNAYEDMATKFFEHYIHIADAINCLGGDNGGTGLWDEDDGFYYDRLHVHDKTHPLKVRSLVGLLPLITATIINRDAYDRLPGFRKRTEWFLKYRQDLAQQITYLEAGGQRKRKKDQAPEFLLAIPSRNRFERVLAYLLDENEFLSPYGIRSLSKHHADHPFRIKLDGTTHEVAYEPGEARSALFGGNSNWRGPVWFPVNYLIIEALERYHHFYGNDFKIAFPTGSNNMLTLGEVADELRNRLARLFLPDTKGHRPAHGDDARYASDPHFKDLLLFYEYFHAETGRGLGASHQTGWTALVSECLRNPHG